MNRPPHFSMLRGFHLADWFTLANAACGMAALFGAMAYLQSGRVTSLLIGAAFVPAALVFDVLDGRIARWRQQQSAMGRELDSLADIISFGVAPAALGYAAGLQGLWDCLILLYFVCCGVSRLARYNITAEAMSVDAGKVKYFEGTPIPSSVLLVAVVAAITWLGHIGADVLFGSVALGPWVLHPLSLMYAVSGSLMISKTLRIPKL
ncbi:MAG: CDP-alcohol phosphatidyltransferase family protein [Tahibacter sp.]